MAAKREELLKVSRKRAKHRTLRIKLRLLLDRLAGSCVVRDMGILDGTSFSPSLDMFEIVVG